MNSFARAWATRVPWATALAASAAVVVQLWPDVAPALIYDRTRILTGEAWRLWTGHWVHLSAAQCCWNLAVLVPAGAWAERIAPQRTRLLLALGPGIISGVLLAFDPALARYAGLSGLAAGLLALLSFTQLSAKDADRWFWWSTLGLLAAKIGVESFVTQPLFAPYADPAVPAVPLAHVAGVATAGVLHVARRRNRAAV